MQHPQIQVTQVQRTVIEEDGAAIVGHELYLSCEETKA
ncbi:hypothetical protein C4K40_5292 [Pseudomonas sp. CMR5c]|nr:hypothetical protein C4K40_5292 [Pseudomonas sp. CMR5c]